MIAMKPDLLASLTSSADAEVDQVLLHGSSGMLTAPRTEVGFVAAVTLGGVPGIASEWSRLLRPHGFKLEMHGVFCHVAPVVEFQTARNSTIGCELADLLVVIDYVGLNGQVRRKASLIQAKMASKANRVSLTGPSSVKQLYLYQNWPRFKFRESVYGSNQYDLTSCQRRRQNRPRGGAKVGQWRGTKRHGACAPQIVGMCHGALARRANSVRCDQVAARAFRARLWLRR